MLPWESVKPEISLFRKGGPRPGSAVSSCFPAGGRPYRKTAVSVSPSSAGEGTGSAGRQPPQSLRHPRLKRRAFAPFPTFPPFFAQPRKTCRPVWGNFPQTELFSDYFKMRSIYCTQFPGWSGVRRPSSVGKLKEHFRKNKKLLRDSSYFGHNLLVSYPL